MGCPKVSEAVDKLNEAKAATVNVTGAMAKAIQSEAADVMAELGLISNDLNGEA
jgi:post-segregation antitoxin (ccd killing protein)